MQKVQSQVMLGGQNNDMGSVMAQTVKGRFEFSQADTNIKPGFVVHAEDFKPSKRVAHNRSHSGQLLQVLVHDYTKTVQPKSKNPRFNYSPTKKTDVMAPVPLQAKTPSQ